MSRDINTILVLGAGGTMGHGIALVAAQAGYNVHGFDLQQQDVDRGMQHINRSLDGAIKREKITTDQKSQILSRITPYTNLEQASQDVDFVIEAIIEDDQIKIETFQKLDQLLEDDVIIASNTSTISISLLGGGSNRGPRFIGMHFFNPPEKMHLIEIIRGLETTDETLEVTKEIASKMKKEVVIAKDSPGFIVNRILLPMINEAVFAYDEGVATAEDIDKGIKLGLGHPMGPLRLLDLIGLDTALKVSDAFYKATMDSKYRVSPLMRNMVHAGKLGRKTGEGFYKY